MVRPVMTAAELREHQVQSYGRDYSVSDDGYSDMEAEGRKGWSAIAGWGADGYDLGDWPYVVISTRGESVTRPDGTGPFELMQCVEGDRTVYRFSTREDREAAIDYLFIWYGIGREYPEWERLGVTSAFDTARTPGTGSGYIARAALDAGTLRVPESLRGPYSRARSEAVAS